MKALFSKLKWQQQELSHQLLTIKQQVDEVAQEMEVIHEKISEPYTISTFILPEVEISRANFITHQQQQHKALSLRETALLSEQTQLKAQQTRLNIELKMLEKHQETKQKSQHKQILLTQQNTSDEWILQRFMTNGVQQ